MASDHLEVGPSLVLDLAEAVGHVAMRRAMEPITAELVARVIQIRNAVQVCRGSHRLMERRIEDGHIFSVW